jgi:uncharacterized protein (TIGR02246 family)
VKKLILLFITALFIMSCSSSHPATAPVNVSVDDKAVLAAAKADIDAANEAWLPGLRNRDAQSIVAAYADDGIFVGPDGTITRGRDAIAQMYAARFTRLREITAGGVVQDGVTVINPDLIYEWGHAWLEMVPETAGQQPVRSGGSYLTVWRRGADNHWHIVRNLAM